MIAVRHRDGWCATRRTLPHYNDSVKTLCGCVVTLPYEVAEMGSSQVDCVDCRYLLDKKAGPWRLPKVRKAGE